MNILEQTEALKDMPDAALIQQMKMPTGQIAPIFITSELKRRKRMRDDYARREAADTPTVAEEVVMAAGMPSGGIADAARALAPKTDMGQNTGMGDMMPRTATRAPQPMASGGIVGMRQGGKLVKVGRAKFYAFPDGEVFVENPDGSREAVTDPRVLGVVRAQANVGPERQESAAPLGSEILQEAAPQRPTLDSTLSSDRPFNPQQMEVTDTRPAVPSNLGMGGERPATLTDATQPTALSEMEKARLATEFTQQQELARAIRDQQEQGIASLNPPSAPAIEATPYDPFIPIEPRIGERSIGVGDTFSRAAEAREQGLDMPDSTRSALLDAMSPASDTFGGDFLGESQARANIANAAKLKELRNTQPNVGTDPRFGDTMGLQEVLAGDFDPVPAPSNAKRDFDVMVPTIDRDSSIDQQLLSKALEAKSLPITPTEDFRREFADYGDDISPFDPADIKNKNFLASAADYFGFKPNEDSLAGRDPAQAKINELKAIINGDADPEVKARAATELLELQNRLAVTRTGGDVSATAEGNEITVPEGYTIGPFGPVVDPNYQTPGKTGFSIVDQAAVQGTDDLNMLREAGIFPEATIDKATPIAELADYESSILPINKGIMDINNALNNPYLSPADKNTLADRAKELEKQKDDIAKTIGGSASALFTPPRSGQEVGGFEGLVDVNTPTAAGQPRYDVDQLPGPIGAGTEADPITMGGARVGIEAARPKAAPVALKAERDAAKISALDGSGITTVSTKAINDAAKQSKGLSTDAWLAIAQGGAAMAASKNPTLLGAFGEGAGVAAAGLQKQRAAEKTAGLEQAKIDATLEAARIRAAASMAGKARPQVTETALFTELSKELRDKEFLLNSAGDNLAPAIRDSLTKRVEEIKERLARVERGESLIGPVARGTDDVKKISL